MSIRYFVISSKRVAPGGIFFRGGGEVMTTDKIFVWGENFDR